MISWRHLHSSDPRKKLAKAAILEAAGVDRGKITGAQVLEGRRPKLAGPVKVRASVLAHRKANDEDPDWIRRRGWAWSHVGVFEARIGPSLGKE